MGIRRMWWSVLRRWGALVLGATLLTVLTVRLPAELSTQQHFPAQSPASIAHILADFSTQPQIGSWSIDEDRSNYTTWRYIVSFACGTRCTGRALIQAHDEPHATPQHGHSVREHRVTVERYSCTSLPFISWPQFCEELQTSAVLTGSDGGALLREVSRTRCSALASLSGACGRWLRAQRDLRIMMLRGLRDAPQVA